MQLGGQQALEQLGLQGQQTQEQLATQFSQLLHQMGLGQQYGLETLGLQGEQALEQIGLQGQLSMEQMLAQQEAITERDFGLQEMQSQAAQELERLRQKGQLTLEEMKQKFALEQQLKQLAFEREALYVQYKGQDPVRAVMLGMGMLGEGQAGGQFRDVGPGGVTGPGQTRSSTAVQGAGGGGRYLPQIAGAGEFERQTEKALGGLLGGRQIDITAEGALGLPTAEKAATAFQRGGAGAKTLLSSGYGVGHEGIGGGLSSEEFTRRIQDVTPTGVIG
jgi:hypothetical protein